MKNENKIKNYENGFLIYWFSVIVQSIHYISPVEQLKNLFVWINKSNTNVEKRQSKTYAIDTFILLKWLYVILIIAFKCNGLIHVVIVTLLIFFNLFSYFYYHIWDEEALVGKDFKTNRVRRRFLNVLSAIAFSHLAFAYLYCFQYHCHFQPDGTNIELTDVKSSFWNWLCYSVSNSIAANFNAIQPRNVFGHQLSMVQLMVSFIFITIILSKSLPDAEKENNQQAAA
jgi:hypothetical protein